MLVRVIPVSAGRLTHTIGLAIPLRNREAIRESADVVLRQLRIRRLHFLLVLIPELFVLWEHRWAISSRRRTLTQPCRGVVVLDEKLLLPVLPFNWPVRPQQRLVTVHAIRKDFVEDGCYRLLVDHWQAITPKWAGSNIEEHIVGDSTRTDVSTMKVQIR